MVVGKLILKLGIEAENLDALKQFEAGAEKGAKAATAQAKSADKVTVAKKKMGMSLREVARDLNKFRMYAALAVTAMTAMSIYGGKVAASLRRFELNTGLSTQKLQEWQQQAALSGVSADEMASSVSGLQQAMTEIRLGGGNVAPFATLGVSINRDPFKVLEQLKARLKSFSPEMGTTLAMQMGLSESMIAMLREMDDIKGSDKNLILTGREQEDLKEFNVYFNRVWDNIRRTATKVGAVMSPIAKTVLWVADRFAKAFITITGWIKKAEPFFKRWKILIVAIGLALAGWMVGPVIASLISLAAALEDVAGYQRGDNSVTGGVIGWLKDTDRVAQDLILTIASLMYAFETLTFQTALNAWGAKLSGQPMYPQLSDQIADLASGGGLKYNDAEMAVGNRPGTRPYGASTAEMKGWGASGSWGSSGGSSGSWGSKATGPVRTITNNNTISINNRDPLGTFTELQRSLNNLTTSEVVP